jgi:hypothetical protein
MDTRAFNIFMIVLAAIVLVLSIIQVVIGLRAWLSPP